MRYRFAAIGLCAAGLLTGAPLPGADPGEQRVQVSKTEMAEFPAGGTLRMQNSTGQLAIEGRDQPGVEITTTISSKEAYLPADREKAAQGLDRVKISTKRSGDELVVTTEYPRHRAFPYVTPLDIVTDFDLSYQIKVPRNARIMIDHGNGDVSIENVVGNVQATARQGEILLLLPGDMPRSIEAKSDLGSVTSDFPGKETRRRVLWPFEEQYAGAVPAAAQSVHLKIGFGDIIILKARNPQPPPPLKQPG